MINASEPRLTNPLNQRGQMMTKTLYEGYAIAALLPDSFQVFKETIQQRVHDEERFSHPMKDYVSHLTVARELPRKVLAKALALLPTKPLTIEVGELVLLPTQKDYALLALSIHSPELEQINRSISDLCGNTEAFRYRHHVTLDCIRDDKRDILACKLLKHLLPAWPRESRCALQGFGVYDQAGTLNTLHTIHSLLQKESSQHG